MSKHVLDISIEHFRSRNLFNILSHGHRLCVEMVRYNCQRWVVDENPSPVLYFWDSVGSYDGLRSYSRLDPSAHGIYYAFYEREVVDGQNGL